MKTALWALIPVVGTGLALYIVLSSWYPSNSVETFIAVCFFAAPGIGGLWMAYHVVRHSKHIFPLIFIAMLPYTFIWYYFERIRPAHIHKGAVHRIQEIRGKSGTA